ncbi:hypothetical protein Acsp06_04730 [Actinomycetospora sp. NBRC 106375]|uniref:rhomboid-like protein n=1 Tax=Actinomycetospora sp. NBRC 106375 TaxID=3032207 RepID=UPI0024A12DA0|nr:rhomboid-like protein [Actinomycetospora sp. NBRC 106375]GLZ44288.1 hypothetical protein Acsp06_04730 [Actinomycetospora sp. NBRC 106375]
MRSYLRAGPVTAAYLAVLVVTHVVLTRTGAFAPAQAWSSTNVENLARHPLGSLASSLVFLSNGPTITAGTVAIVVVGVGGALWWLESRHGLGTACAAFVGGHAGATAVTALVILVAVRAGVYPAAVLAAPDVGVSYGAQAAAACVVALLPRWASVAGGAVLVAWPLLDATWFGAVPDFTTVGHLVSAVLGFAVGLLVRRRSRASTRRTGSAGSNP